MSFLNVINSTTSNLSTGKDHLTTFMLCLYYARYGRFYQE